MSAAMQWPLADAARAVPQARVLGDGAVRIDRVHTDTRSVQPGDLFVALRGERFDATQFLGEAAAKGAVAVLCDATAEPALAAMPGLAGASRDCAIALVSLPCVEGVPPIWTPASSRRSSLATGVVVGPSISSAGRRSRSGTFCMTVRSSRISRSIFGSFAVPSGIVERPCALSSTTHPAS